MCEKHQLIGNVIVAPRLRHDVKLETGCTLVDDLIFLNCLTRVQLCSTPKLTTIS